MMNAKRHKCRVLVLIGGSGSNLQAIINHAEKTQHFEGIQVISHNPNVFGLVRAQKAKIPTLTLSHKAYNSRELFEQALQSAIDKTQPDLIILAGFMRILSESFVENYIGKFLNIHPSLLPKYKGLNTHQRALDAQEAFHGASVHFVTAELDGGPIVAQVKIPIQSDDTAESLKQKIQTIEHWLYPKVISWFSQGRLSHTQSAILFDKVPLLKTGLQLNFYDIGYDIEGIEQ